MDVAIREDEHPMGSPTRAPKHRDGDGDSTRRRAPVLLAAAVAAYAASLSGWILLVALHRAELWSTVDLHTYYDAVQSLGASQHRIYRRSFGPWPGPFLYPPFAAVVFAKLAPLGLDGLRLLVTGAGQVALLAAARSTWKLLGRPAGSRRTAATFALAAAAVWLDPVAKTFYFGQISILLLALVLADLARPDASPSKGVLIGLATGLKLTPAVFVVYLVLTRRYRAAAVAAGTFAATVAAGLFLLPGASSDFWLHSRDLGTTINRHVSMADATDQALRPLLMRAFGPGTAADGAWLALAAVVAFLGMAAAQRASSAGQEASGVLIVAGVSLVVSPISWTHHWVWCVPLLAFFVDRAMRAGGGVRWWLLTAAYTAVMFAWPMRLTGTGAWSAHVPLLPYGIIWMAPHQDGREFHWTAWQFLYGDAMVLANLAVLLWACRHFLRGVNPWSVWRNSLADVFVRLRDAVRSVPRPRGVRAG